MQCLVPQNNFRWLIKKKAPIAEHCVFGEVKSDLIECVLKVINPGFEKTLRAALKNFNDAEQDDIIDVMDCLQGKWSPTAQNIKQLVNDIALREFLQKPKFIFNNWSKVLFGLTNTEDYGELYTKLSPSAKNVLAILSTSSIQELDSDMIRVLVS